MKGGHELVFGSRSPANSTAEATAASLGARVVEPAAAAAWAEIVVLAVPWTGLDSAIRGLGDLDGKIVIDATNPVALGQPDVQSPADLGFSSGAEAVAAWALGARVVKAFNTTGAANLSQPRIAGQALPALLCGETEAVGRVAELATSMGFEPIALGGLDRAHLAEEAARLWITLAYQQGRGPDFAFVVARR